MTSIIVINWNGLEDTIECIQSILKHTQADYHLYIIDNGSDNSEGQKLVEEYATHPLIDVECYEQNLGFVGAHNRIWEEKIRPQDSQYLALINNDTIVTPLWLQKLTDTATEEKAKLVAPILLDYYNRTTIDNIGHVMLSSGEIIPKLSGKALTSNFDQKKQVGVCGGAALIATEMIRDLGFFDTHFTTGYEDAELGLRALICGYPTSVARESMVLHKGGNSVKKIFSDEYVIQNHRNMLYTVVKNYPLPLLLISFPFIILRYLLVIMLSFVFLRWRYSRIIVKSLLQFFGKDFKKVLEARSSIASKRKLGTLEFLKFLRSTIIFDLKRFYNILILRKSSALDKYR